MMQPGVQPRPVQAPNGQLYMIPSNAYPVISTGQEQPVTLQTIQLQGMNNEGFKET